MDSVCKKKKKMLTDLGGKISGADMGGAGGGGEGGDVIKTHSMYGTILKQ